MIQLLINNLNQDTRKMKKIYSLLLVLLASAVTLTSCKEDEPFATAGEDDFPQILLPWFGEWKDGVPGEYKNITRDTEFVDSCTVTPARYTTVSWIIDGEKVAEGTRINRYFLAGTYRLQIVATTTKGLSTSRTGFLVVRPCEGDPTLADDAKSRYCEVGSTKTIEGDALEGIKAVYINGVATQDVKCEGNTLSFLVPEMEDGTYKIVVETADMQYGCGDVTVSNEPWVDPSIVEVTLWEGDWNVTWDTPFKELQEKSKEYVADGTFAPDTEVRVYVEGEGQGAVTSSWWNNILTGKGDPERGDIAIVGSQTLVYTLNDISMVLIKNENGLFVVGNGYHVKKVTVMKVAGPKVLWEGDWNVTWDTPFKELQEQSKALVADGTIAPGKVLKVHVEGEGQGAVTSSWWNNILTGNGDPDRGDIMISGKQILEYELNQTSIKLINEQDGLFVVGNGYVVTKVTIE